MTPTKLVFIVVTMVAVAFLWFNSTPATNEIPVGAATSTPSKSEKIVSAVQKGEHVRSKYTIEIVDIKPIENGLELFARVSQGGKQIGFGKDGTVDVERFRLINPPTIVPDLNGDIINDYID